MTSYTIISLVAAYLCFIITLTNGQGQNLDLSRLLNAFNEAERNVRSMRGTVQYLDENLADRQKRTCAVGINSHHCSVAELDARAMQQEYLRSGFSPGKRSMRDSISTPKSNPENQEDALNIVTELAKKRKDLADIRSMLDEAEETIKQHRKRTCQVELGGACRTEWASAIADQFYYLMGPNSPGKRKRRSPMGLMQKRIADILENKKALLKN